MYKLCVYVPESHVEPVKAAMFAAGAGRVGHYEHCAWQVLGQGQFKPLAGSNPFIGTLDELEQVPEYRVELICDDNLIETVLVALKRAHPYEEPAYDVIRLEAF